MISQMLSYIATHQSELLKQIGDHFVMSLSALLIASVIGIICGYFASKSEKSEQIVSAPLSGITRCAFTCALDPAYSHYGNRFCASGNSPHSFSHPTNLIEYDRGLSGSA